MPQRLTLEKTASVESLAISDIFLASDYTNRLLVLHVEPVWETILSNQVLITFAAQN